MKKKRAIRNYVLISIFIVVTLLLTFISCPVPGTTYNFMGLGNLHLGLELGGGVKNTYEIEMADWYEGSKQTAYVKTVDRIQSLLDKKYADAKVYLCEGDKITIEVPDTQISDTFVVGLIEMKSASGAEAEAKITGQDIDKVEYMLSGTVHGVYIEFNEKGKEKYAALTKEVAESDSQKMYIYMNKDYENPFSEPTVSEENKLGYTFISGSGITNKSTGQDYADKLFSATLGVNMTTDLDSIEVQGTFGGSVRIVIYAITIVMVIACIVIAYILFKQLGLVSSLSFIFALMVSVIISAICDLQITFAGWLGFMFGFVINFLLHIYYLNCINKEYAKGKKFLVSFTSGYRSALFNMLDILLVVTGVSLLMLIVPSSAIRMFVFNYLITLAGTAFTALYLNKVVAVNYTAFNLKNEKKINFTREDMIDEVE